MKLHEKKGAPIKKATLKERREAYQKMLTKNNFVTNTAWELMMGKYNYGEDISEKNTDDNPAL